VYLRGIKQETTIIMRKTTLILAFLAVVACGGAQTDSPFRCDTTGISIFNALVDGKLLPVPLIYCSEDKRDLTYEISQPFVENDTQYIRRTYQFYKCDTCSTYDTCISSFFWCTHCLEQILGKYYAREPDFSGTEWYTLGAAYRFYRESFPDLTLTQNNLGNMPRKWFWVKKYQGKYVVTSDYPYHKYFTDSLIVHSGMEDWFSPLYHVKELSVGMYYYEDDNYYHNIMGMAKSRNWLLPSVLVKGLYVMTSLLSDGTLEQLLVTPMENLQYFDCINSNLCELDYLDYDDVDFEAHINPALMADIRNLQQYLKEQASKGKRKTDTEEHPMEPIVVEGVELFPADGNTPVKSFSDTVSGEPPVMFAEEMPEFPGGPDSLNAFLTRNIQWPIGYGCATGTVLVEFIVEKDGTITHPTISVSLMPEFDKEALRLVSLMPKWKPARAQGVPVRCYYKIPVTFSM
jgi:TonB family protein